MSRESTPLIDKHALARVLDVDVRTLGKFLDEGMPVAVRGRGGRASRYDAQACIAWKLSRDGAAAAAMPDLMQSRARKELAQAVESEQRVAIKAGKLLHVEDVDRVWSTHIAAVRSKLLAFPQVWADRIHRAATLQGVAGIEKVLETAVTDALTELADGIKPKRPRRKVRR